MSSSTYRLTGHVVHPLTGQPYSPELSVAIDPRTGRIVSWRVQR